MSSTSARSPAVYGYHTHVYYNAETFPIAERLRETLAANFPVELGRFSGEQVGPHPAPQFQIVFNKCAVADARPRGPRHSHPFADRRYGRRPHRLRAMA
jgi:aromatic ring-cleaving dioxygenase